jgi:hypothetical protein
MQYDYSILQNHALRDRRFRELVGEKKWILLPSAVRRRFGKHLTGGTSVVYRGVVIAMRMSRIGRILAQLARLIGGPLPYDMSSTNQPAVVTVTEDCAGDGQFWTRQYGRKAGFPQIIHSSKRFSGPTGIEEYIGSGIGIALRVNADSTGLSFESDHYFLKISQFRLRFPTWLQPGALTITHRDLGNDWFLFSLSLYSHFLGELVRQDALFHDSEE